jgi:hypothetical protein
VNGAGVIVLTLLLVLLSTAPFAIAALLAVRSRRRAWLDKAVDSLLGP